jgi:hypothetical protein
MTDKNGIIDGYYYVNGKIAYNKGLIELENGKVIYVRSNGKVATGVYYVTNLSNYNGTDVKVCDKVTFDTNGYMVAAKNGVVDGYYYENGRIAYNKGLIEYNGGYIYVRSNGQVATGKYWVTNNNGLMKSDFYVFGEDGMMIVE